MRIFVALDIPEEIRERLKQFAERLRPLAPEARWSRIEGLHVTLKFIGEISETKVQDVKVALTPVKAEPFPIEIKGAGFFPNPHAARVFWAGVQASEALPQLASAVDSVLDSLKIPREQRAYQAHLTLARAPEGRESRHCFRLLQERLGSEEPPYFGTITAQQFFLYQSEMMRGGSRYTKLQRFGLQ